MQPGTVPLQQYQTHPRPLSVILKPCTKKIVSPCPWPPNPAQEPVTDSSNNVRINSMLVPMDSEMQVPPDSDRSDKSNTYPNATVRYVYPSVSRKSHNIGNASRLETESRMAAAEERSTMLVPTPVQHANPIAESRTGADRIGSIKNPIMPDPAMVHIMEKSVNAAVRPIAGKGPMEYPYRSNNSSVMPPGKINDPNPAIRAQPIMPNMVGNNSIMIGNRYNAPDRYQEGEASSMARRGDAVANSTYKSSDRSTNRTVGAGRSIAKSSESRISDDRRTTIGEPTSAKRPMNPYPNEPEQPPAANKASPAYENNNARNVHSMSKEKAPPSPSYRIASRSNNEDSVAYSSSIGNYASNTAGAVGVANASTAMAASPTSNASSANRDIMPLPPRCSTDARTTPERSPISKRKTSRDSRGQRGSITANAIDGINAHAGSTLPESSSRYSQPFFQKPKANPQPQPTKPISKP